MVKKIMPAKRQMDFYCFFGIALLVFIGFFLLNCKMGYINDDYTYRFIFNNWRLPSNPVRVSSLKDIYTGMYNHYMIWGGRIPVHVAVQFFLMFDKIFFNVCNSLMVVLLGILIYFHANFNKRRNLFLFVFIFFLLWFFVPAANETMIFLTGSINYLWVSVFILLFLVPYRIQFVRAESLKHASILFILMIPLGFLAGWSNEPGGGAAWLLAASFLLYHLKTKARIPIWGVSGILSVTAGLLVLVFAPGYQKKASNLYQAESVLNYALSHLGETIENVFKQTFFSLWPLFLIFSGSLSVLIYVVKRENDRIPQRKKAVVKKSLKTKMSTGTKFLVLLYTASSFACFAIYLVSPEFVIRYLFMSTTLLIVVIGLLISEATEHTDIAAKKNQKLMACLVGACLIIIMIDGVYQFRICSYNYQHDNMIKAEISAQVEQGEKNVILRGEYAIIKGGRFNIFKMGWNYTIFWGGSDPNFEFNKLLAIEFGCDTYINEANIYYIDAKDYFS